MRVGGHADPAAARGAARALPLRSRPVRAAAGAPDRCLTRCSRRCTGSASRSRCRPPTSRSRCPRPARRSGSARRARAREPIERGEIAAVVLAGGMATRFGSRVKALAPVLDGRDLTFLDLKLADLTRFGVDVTLMTSFATHDALAEAVAGTGVQLAPQLVSLRLHGGRRAVPRRRRRALAARAGPRRPRGRAARSRARSSATGAAGVRTLFVCNVDNVGATLDPALVGPAPRAGRRRHRGARLQAPRRRRRPARAARRRLARDRRGLPGARGLPARALPALQSRMCWPSDRASSAYRFASAGSVARSWLSCRRPRDIARHRLRVVRALGLRPVERLQRHGSAPQFHRDHPRQ